ncbi:MAG TPA: hypothetical protein VG227_06640 [Caulobacteraceae bacterium]|nr:hypothetical protein [Caulobacteraceae bacterium]
MRHARPEDLDRLEPLLARLRALPALPALKEKSRGVFYWKGRSFLHFHADPAGLFADVREAGGRDFIRLQVNGAAGADQLVSIAALQVGDASGAPTSKPD